MDVWRVARLGRSLALPILLLLCGVAGAQTAAPAASDELSPGVKLTIRSGSVSDARPARLIALAVPVGTSPTPFLQVGPFTAVWEGLVNLRIRGEYSFRPVGTGTVKIFVNEKAVVCTMGEDLAGAKGEPVKLTKGKNKIRVEYTSPEKADAIFRLYWSERGPAEPVSPMVLLHDPKDAELVAKWEVHEGRGLFGELRCIRCHTDPFPTQMEKKFEGAGPALVMAMQELWKDAPNLENAGARLSEKWMAAWIANPQSINPRAEMPRMFADAQPAADIAAYLATLKEPLKTETPAAATPALLAGGARLYANLGCIACHTPPNHAGEDSVVPKRIPHKYVAEKFTPVSLRLFLRQPNAFFLWVRMPDFRLTDAELDQLVAYLFSNRTDSLPAAPKGDAVRGKELFNTAGCLNCHGSQPEKATGVRTLVELKGGDLGGGCLAADAAARKKAPDFGFDDRQRQALATFLKGDTTSIQRESSIEFADRQFVQLNCAACHPRDKQDDVWSGLSKEVESIVAGLPPEEGGEHFAPDQSRPSLTWIGEKLRPIWMTQFISGHIQYKPRPWLRARMPGFLAGTTSHALVAQGFSEEHGFSAKDVDPRKSDPALAEVGRKLAGKNGGFSCVQCHAVGEQKALAPFEAPAPNFAHVAERLRREYYDRWMMKPQRVQPGTRMPDFADIEGETPLKAYFDGDAPRQFDAIWNYLLEGEKIEPPAQ